MIIGCLDKPPIIGYNYKKGGILELKNKKLMENKAKILIIEDEEVLVNMYESKFISENYQVIKANNGEDGYLLTQKEKPDIILLDVILPKMDGFMVLNKIKQDLGIKDIPVILLTNLGQDEDIKKGKKMGAVDYLVKANLTPSEVVDKIKEILKK